mmetsp:Transcript_67786/g.180506  ORF Transcript_67786/g.180506 Transcript_67786/m.180506 type:complete len:265 (-) Transcript_67786:212-1006(-)
MLQTGQQLRRLVVQLCDDLVGVEGLDPNSRYPFVVLHIGAAPGPGDHALEHIPHAPVKLPEDHVAEELLGEGHIAAAAADAEHSLDSRYLRLFPSGLRCRQLSLRRLSPLPRRYIVGGRDAEGMPELGGQAIVLLGAGSSYTLGVSFRCIVAVHLFIPRAVGRRRSPDGLDVDRQPLPHQQGQRLACGLLPHDLLRLAHAHAPALDDLQHHPRRHSPKITLGIGNHEGEAGSEKDLVIVGGIQLPTLGIRHTAVRTSLVPTGTR